MVSNFVACHEPVGNEGIIRVIKGDIVGHSWRTAIRILTLSKKLVDGIKGVGLDGIVGSIDEKLRDISLAASKDQKLSRHDSDMGWHRFHE
jgi:hypothetical protein